jgi:hypothetical protein|tara:strand:+ start:115 stop:327 length:213 start_codon:yes stop_codon:yes gene_type:complete
MSYEKVNKLKREKQCDIHVVIGRLIADENKMMHGSNENGSYMHYTKDGYYISINQIFRTLKEMGIKYNAL